MVEPFLIITVVVVSLLLLGAMVLVLIVFAHPDDKNAAYFPKVVTIAGLWLAFASLLVLPYDVAASKSSGGGGIRVDVLWQIVYIVLAVMLAFIIPYAFFYYENDQDEEAMEDAGMCEKQGCMALKYTLGLAVVLILLLVIMYAFLHNANIPVKRYAQLTNLVYPYDLPFSQMKNNQSSCSLSFNCVVSNFNWTIPVSFPLYVIAFLAFLGWFFFTLFLGVGFFALPLDLINEYRTRPTPISTKVYFEERTNLGGRAKKLIEIAEKLSIQLEKGGKSRGARRQENRDLKNFEKHYYYLKKDYQILYIAHQLKGGNPLVYIFKGFLGCIFICLSILWFIHIAIFVLPRKPYHPFLNEFFVDLESGIPSFPLFGVLAFALFAFYLLWCVVKGNFRLGVRFLIIKLYPMEVGNTLMNAFLFNTWIILLTSVPAVQFCITAFPIYAKNTQADVMFGTQIQYLDFFRYFFMNNVFIIAMLVICGITILILTVCPTNKAEQIEATLDRIAKNTNTSTSLQDALDDD